MNRREILEYAEEAITRDRAATHGKAEDSFAQIAALWSVILGVQLCAVDVARMMVLFKVVRSATNAGHLDNWMDMVGYAAIGGELATETSGPAEPGPAESMTQAAWRAGFGNV